MWSFVGRRKCAWWTWVALDAEARQAVAMMVGNLTFLDRLPSTTPLAWSSVRRNDFGSTGNRAGTVGPASAATPVGSPGP